MRDIENELCDEDAKLFADMEGKYISLEEKLFFETLKYRQERDLTLCNDPLIGAKCNDDNLFLLRLYYDEYIVGHYYDYGKWNDIHKMNLFEVLNVNLNDIGCNKRMTLWEWLRSNNYRYINYEQL